MLMIILILISLFFITQSIIDNTNEIIKIKEELLHYSSQAQ